MRESYWDFTEGFDESGFSYGATDSSGIGVDGLYDGPAEVTKRVTQIAFCTRCGCRLSQYRDTDDNLCCACHRALNPLFDQSA
ncbi:MAG: hypothetical protein ACYC1U_09825 [Candidatus Aquicultorales bacterium]